VLQSEKYNKRIATDPRKYVVARAGQFAFDPMSLYYGAIGRVDVESGLISPDYVVFDADCTVDSEFLTYFLRAPQQVRKYESVAETGNQFGKRRRVYWSVFEQLSFVLPPLSEQRRIAAILSAVDAVIEKTEAMIKIVQALKRAMMQELLTRGVPGRRHMGFKETEIGELPEGWVVVSLGDSATFENGRAFKPEDWSVDGLPIIRIQNLNGGKDYNYFNGKVEPRYRVAAGDLLFSWSGTRGTSFGPHVWSGPDGVLNQHIFNVRNFRGVTKAFMLHVLKFVTASIEKRAHGGTGIVHITKGELESTRFGCPGLDEQESISDALDSIDLRLVTERNTRAALNRVKSNLVSALLTGELRVTPHEDTA